MALTDIVDCRALGRNSSTATTVSAGAAPATVVAFIGRPLTEPALKVASTSEKMASTNLDGDGTTINDAYSPKVVAAA